MAIYNESKDVVRMFAYPRYVIKGGEVVIEEGEIRKTVEGKGLLVRPAYDEKIEDYIRPLFQQYYTMSFDNYPVEMERIEHPDIQPVQAAEPHEQDDLHPEGTPHVPLEAEVFSPDVIAPLGHAEVLRPAGVPGQAPVPHGRLLRGRGRRAATTWRCAATRAGSSGSAGA